MARPETGRGNEDACADQSALTARSLSRRMKPAGDPGGGFRRLFQSGKMSSASDDGKARLRHQGVHQFVPVTRAEPVMLAHKHQRRPL